MKLKDAIEFLENQINDPKVGLPEDIFLLISRITPLVNVDLLIKDEVGRVLLSWRDDIYAGTGWHVPGGIIRFKETYEQRILKVSEEEIGTIVKYDSEPIAINQVMTNQNTRGHFISLLYKCFVPGEFIPTNQGITNKDKGFLQWHNSCPNNLIKVHEIYRKFM